MLVQAVGRGLSWAGLGWAGLAWAGSGLWARLSSAGEALASALPHLNRTLPHLSLGTSSHQGFARGTFKN